MQIVRARYLHVVPSLSVSLRAKVGLRVLRALPSYLGLVHTRMPASRLHVDALELDVAGRPTVVPRGMGKNASGALLFFWELVAGEALDDAAPPDAPRIGRDLPTELRDALVALPRSATVRDVVDTLSPFEEEHFPEGLLEATLKRIRSSTRLFSDGIVTPLVPPPSKSTRPAPASTTAAALAKGSLLLRPPPSVESLVEDSVRESAPPRESLVRAIDPPVPKRGLRSA